MIGAERGQKVWGESRKHEGDRVARWVLAFPSP
ncbi:MAG: hypothetical protein CM15mP103_00030 [Gammaproteobacteria bacterium]|nr:MAG: hypothetical protein CM15mP103_00030 [Gammaproteobacteria bacterium]